jgi:hypothetical protein
MISCAILVNALLIPVPSSITVFSAATLPSFPVVRPAIPLATANAQGNKKASPRAGGKALVDISHK